MRIVLACIGCAIGFNTSSCIIPMYSQEQLYGRSSSYWMSRGPYLCHTPSQYEGRVVGDGACVALVAQCFGAPDSSRWKEGKRVKGASVFPGTAIATFVDGRYPQGPAGQHAAIYIEQDTDGIVVWDQWPGQPIQRRKILFRGGEGPRFTDGDAFSVIE